MSLQTVLARTTLVLGLAGLITFVGCTSQSDPGGKGNASAQTKKVTVDVTDMTWAVGWPPRVRDALATLPWVKDVQVNYERKQATFTAETAKYDEAEIARVLKDAGFGLKAAK